MIISGTGNRKLAEGMNKMNEIFIKIFFNRSCRKTRQEINQSKYFKKNGH